RPGPALAQAHRRGGDRRLGRPARRLVAGVCSGEGAGVRLGGVAVVRLRGGSGVLGVRLPGAFGVRRYGGRPRVRWGRARSGDGRLALAALHPGPDQARDQHDHPDDERRPDEPLQRDPRLRVVLVRPLPPELVPRLPAFLGGRGREDQFVPVLADRGPAAPPPGVERPQRGVLAGRVVALPRRRDPDLLARLLVVPRWSVRRVAALGAEVRRLVPARGSEAGTRCLFPGLVRGGGAGRLLAAGVRRFLGSGGLIRGFGARAPVPRGGPGGGGLRLVGAAGRGAGRGGGAAVPVRVRGPGPGAVGRTGGRGVPARRVGGAGGGAGGRRRVSGTGWCRRRAAGKGSCRRRRRPAVSGRWATAARPSGGPPAAAPRPCRAERTPAGPGPGAPFREERPGRRRPRPPPARGCPWSPSWGRGPGRSARAAAPSGRAPAPGTRRSATPPGHWAAGHPIRAGLVTCRGPPSAAGPAGAARPAPCRGAPPGRPGRSGCAGRSGCGCAGRAPWPSPSSGSPAARTRHGSAPRAPPRPTLRAGPRPARSWCSPGSPRRRRSPRSRRSPVRAVRRDRAVPGAAGPARAGRRPP